MLVVTRKIDEKITIGDNIEVMVVDVFDDSAKIGITAPKDIVILRNELLDTQKTNKASNRTRKISKNTMKELMKFKKGD